MKKTVTKRSPTKVVKKAAKKASKQPKEKPAPKFKLPKANDIYI